jgi:dephospho-CoA kinase
VVIDADALAREVVAPGTAGHAGVLEAFGDAVLSPDGSLDRPALGTLVFDDADARSRLEAIIHPLVRARARDLEAATDADAVVVHDIPLLVETGQADRFDAVVVVDAPADVQRRRLVELRGMTPEEADRRIAAQASREQRRAAADHIVVNDGSFAELEAQVAALWELLCRQVRVG